MAAEAALLQGARPREEQYEEWRGGARGREAHPRARAGQLVNHVERAKKAAAARARGARARGGRGRARGRGAFAAPARAAAAAARDRVRAVRRGRGPAKSIRAPRLGQAPPRLTRAAAGSTRPRAPTSTRACSRRGRARRAARRGHQGAHPDDDACRDFARRAPYPVIHLTYYAPKATAAAAAATPTPPTPTPPRASSSASSATRGPRDRAPRGVIATRPARGFSREPAPRRYDPATPSVLLSSAASRARAPVGSRRSAARGDAPHCFLSIYALARHSHSAL